MTQLQEKKPFPWGNLLVFVLLLAGTAVSLVFYPQIFGESSYFNQVVSQNDFVQTLFQKIPALIKSVQIITCAIVINFILRFLTDKSVSKTKRGATVAKLLYSFIKWVIIIVTILFVLQAWGVDTTAIIASAGIMTLAVSLGAQSLVADIIAGLFIVVEGEYQVGDIVVIDDWRGTVMEIGIRTTKIQDAGGNIKIVNNSEITSIVNQTQALSLAKATMSIEYGESIPRVELVLRDNLESIKEAIPEIVEGPFYKGVNALSASSVDLLFVANCKEEDLYSVQRAMNRELKLLFDKNNISIPFPQITVNQPNEIKTKTTATMAKAADKFVDEQMELSKHLEEEKQ